MAEYLCKVNKNELKLQLIWEINNFDCTTCIGTTKYSYIENQQVFPHVCSEIKKQLIPNFRKLFGYSRRLLK